jgi:energy-converting hydrogenase A subunit R
LVESDLEGPWVKADHAFDAVARIVPRGERVFSVISSYDDVRFFVEKTPGYEPGDTLMLVAPLLLAYGATDSSLRKIARLPQNTKLVPGARESIRYIKGIDEFYLISTSYEQYVQYAAPLLGVSDGRAYYTSFPIDELSLGIDEEDLCVVRDWADRIAAMPVIDVDESGSVADGSVDAKESLDHFFWEILPGTSFSGLMDTVKPIGGTRKRDALLAALRDQGKVMSEARVIGDSITDSVMLSKAKEAGGLALSFNGNRYSIKSSNVAVISGNCWATAAMVSIMERAGIDQVKVAAEGWGPGTIESLAAGGQVDPEVAREFRRAFPSEESLPSVYWVESSNVDQVIRQSEAFRKRVRGVDVGGLG